MVIDSNIFIELLWRNFFLYKKYWFLILKKNIEFLKFRKGEVNKIYK